MTGADRVTFTIALLMVFFVGLYMGLGANRAQEAETDLRACLVELRKR